MAIGELWDVATRRASPLITGDESFKARKGYGNEDQEGRDCLAQDQKP